MGVGGGQEEERTMPLRRGSCDPCTHREEQPYGFSGYEAHTTGMTTGVPPGAFEVESFHPNETGLIARLGP